VFVHKLILYRWGRKKGGPYSPYPSQPVLPRSVHTDTTLPYGGTHPHPPHALVFMGDLLLTLECLQLFAAIISERGCNRFVRRPGGWVGSGGKSLNGAGGWIYLLSACNRGVGFDFNFGQVSALFLTGQIRRNQLPLHTLPTSPHADGPDGGGLAPACGWRPPSPPLVRDTVLRAGVID
jgi:hypothetical protein